MMARDAKGKQKAALKRKRREREVRDQAARKRAAGAGKNPRRNLARAADFPIEECVISKGWAERGLAHILLVRRLPDGNLLVGGYFVDILCMGLKDSAVVPSVDEKEYINNVKNNLFNDPVEFEACEPGVARGVIEGAIEFAGRYGFKPNRRWTDSSLLWNGVDPKGGGVAFGRDGKPCLVLRRGQKAPGIVARLERRAGPGNYLVEEQTS